MLQGFQPGKVRPFRPILTRKSYIGQFRILEQLTPDFATVVLDDATPLNSVNDTCYTSPASYSPK